MPGGKASIMMARVSIDLSPGHESGFSTIVVGVMTLVKMSAPFNEVVRIQFSHNSRLILPLWLPQVLGVIRAHGYCASGVRVRVYL